MSDEKLTAVLELKAAAPLRRIVLTIWRDFLESRFR
jgi:hypothetical protein